MKKYNFKKGDRVQVYRKVNAPYHNEEMDYLHEEKVCGVVMDTYGGPWVKFDIGSPHPNQLGRTEWAVAPSCLKRIK